jgi:hypothetical protein
MELPKVTISKTEIEEPRRAIPYTDRLAPIREKRRRDSEEAMLTKSSTDSDDPKRAKPNTDKVDPKRK